MPYVIDSGYSSPQFFGCGCGVPALRINLGEAPAKAPAVPRLIKREDHPVTLTLYLHIPLGGESPAPAMTGVFVPANFRPNNPLDLILYLCGHHREAPVQSIARYWNRNIHSYFDFREGINASRKNVVLVAPTLGPRSEAGRLVRPGALDWYLDTVLGALRRYAPDQAPQSGIRHLILACHSGGGLPMRQLATLPSRKAGMIRECWGFDCLYNRGDEPTWAKWAAAHPTSRLFIHYGSGGTAHKSEALRKMAPPNIFVEGRGTLGHNLVPKAHWIQRLKAATFLLNT